MTLLGFELNVEGYQSWLRPSTYPFLEYCRPVKHSSDVDQLQGVPKGEESFEETEV